MADLDAQGTQCIVDYLGLVGTEENQVAALCTSAFQNGLECGLVQVLDDGRLQTGFIRL